MALVIKDRIKETSTTTGTGTLTLAGASTGFKAFSEIGVGNTTYYAISDGTDWEVGLGTVGSGTLSRDTILASSNAGSAVSWNSDVKDVFCTYPADKAVYEQASGLVDVPSLAINGTTVTSTAAELNKLDGFTGDKDDLNYAKDLRATGVTATEYDYLDGVTSNIQTQLDAKIESGDTVASLTITSADINGGTIDGTTIGGSSAAAITGTTITGTSFVSSGDMTFGDNDKAIFGAGSDLQIFHDSGDSYIDDTGTGDLYIRGSDNVRIQVGDGAGGYDNAFYALDASETVIYFAGNRTLATTSTGIDVTGNVVSDGASLDGAVVINESGADVDFRIESDTNTHAFFLEGSSGNVGIGTSSPDQTLHVEKSVAGGGVELLVVNSGANQAGTYSQIGLGTGGDSTGSAYFRLYRDGSGISELGGYTTQTFHTGGSERMRIDSGGSLLVGTTSSQGRITAHSATSNNTTKVIQLNNSSGTELLAIVSDGSFYTGSAANSPYNATTGAGANVNMGSFGQLFRSTSSLKYKTDVQNATHGLAEVLELRPVTYKTKNDGDKVFGGLIAEEVDELGLTEFVQYAEDGSPDALHYGNMVSLAFKAIQEQQAIIESLETRIAALESN